MNPLTLLPPGQRFLLPTTHRIYDQGPNSPTCCAHAVAAAMETRMVKVNAIDPLETPVDPMTIFAAGDSVMSLTVSCTVAAGGVATPRGLEKATTARLPSRIDRMVQALQNDAPLMIEVSVGSNFSAYDGTAIYRTVGPRSLHAVCVIGYGTDAATSEPYWVVKNSYGPTWGDHGCAYIRWADGDVKPEATVFVMRSVAP
jgi:hypothetical protein